MLILVGREVFMTDGKKDSNKDLKNAPMPPLPFAKDLPMQENKEVKKILEKDGTLTLDEAQLLYENLKEKGKVWKQKIDETLKMRGLTEEGLLEHLKNPNNFTPEQWEMLAQKRRDLINFLNLPSAFNEIVKGFAPEFDEYPSKKKDDKSEKRRIGKAQRRGWLPMR